MPPLMAIVYRWSRHKLEFEDRRESALPLALRLGWRVLAKDSDLSTPVPDTQTGEQQQD